MIQRAFTVEEYHRMADFGIIDCEERTELLEGVVVSLSPIGVSHWMRHVRIVKYLVATLDGLAIVPGSISIPLGDRNEPQPDLAILADLPYEHRDRPPEPSEIYALVELSDTSFAKDTRAKRRLYARFGVADYLVVDLSNDVLLHFARPSDGDYHEPRTMQRGDVFRLSALPDVGLAAEAFLAAP